MRGRLRAGANRRPKVVFPLPGNPEITTKGLRIREVVRTTLFWIDTIDLTYYTVVDGDGQTPTAREADVDVGGDQRPAAKRRRIRSTRDSIRSLDDHDFDGFVEGLCQRFYAEDEPANKQTIGLLQRRHVSVGQIIYIGRESNQLEEVEAGTVHDAAGVYTEYVDPQREAWFRAAQVVSLKE